MAYKEPGVYLTTINSTSGSYAGVQMFPCVIGPGARKLYDSDIALTKGTATNGDTLPYKTVAKIVKISAYKGGPAAWAETTDYSLNTVSGQSYIKWVAAKGPSDGESYYVDLVYDVEDSIYDLRLIQSKDDLVAIYGNDIRAYEDNTPTNELVTACKILLENNGGKPVYVRQIKTAAEAPTGDEFSVGLADAAFKDDIWRVVPAITTDSINQLLQQHNTTLSSYEERKERTALLSVPYTAQRLMPSKFDTDTGVLEIIGGYAAAIADKRDCIVYPDTATREFSDGVIRTVSAQMLNAAVAGAEQNQLVSKSRTRMQVTGFVQLGGVKMTRAQMNLLAAKGVMLLTQATSGAPLVVRHQLTTDMSTTQSREMSLVAIGDYCAKTYRLACEMYIGKYNINSETLALISGTLQGKTSELTKSNIINGGSITQVVQDADNLDAVNAAVRVAVPYPCNYIDILMYMD